MAHQWWQAFGDSRLNALIGQALSDHPGLQGTWNRLEQAQAIAERSGAQRFPELESGVSYSLAERSNTTGQSSTKERSLSLAVRYELDLWGKIGAELDAARWELRASREDVDSAAISLTAQIATTWYQLLEQRAQITLLAKQISTNQKFLELVQLQFRSGLAAATDILQQHQTLEASRGEQALARAGLQVLKNRLAVLLGRAPGTLTPPREGSLPPLPRAPKTGLPAQLIRRRPDIRTAFYRLQAADRRVAAAVAQRFPRFSLSASISTTKGETGRFFDNWLSNFTANLVLPLIDGSSRKAEVRRNEGVYAQALNTYKETVLTALEEVENALVRELEQAHYLKSLQAQLTLSVNASNQIRQRYIHGDTDFLRFLNSLLSLQSLERTILRARRELIGYRIGLYKALAGGWEMNQGLMP